MAALDQVVFIFKDFAFLLDEKKKVEEFVQGNRTREEYLAEISRVREALYRPDDSSEASYLAEDELLQLLLT